MREPIRIFIAATPAEWLPQKVLEFSIMETTQCELEFYPLYRFQRHYELPSDLRNRPRTPFSFQRFLIPEICNYAGHAIYMDADMQVFKNIENLWSVPFNEKAIQTVRPASDGRKGQFSVMLMNCAGLNWQIDDIVCQLNEGNLTYEQLMYEMRIAPSIGKDIPTHWNMLERYDSKTSLLHYTDMNTQPWISTRNNFGAIWFKCLRRAVQAGFISILDIENEIKAGHIRPSMRMQLQLEIDDALDLSKKDKLIDKFFVPPYKNLMAKNARPWTSPLGLAKAVIIRINDCLRRSFH